MIKLEKELCQTLTSLGISASEVDVYDFLKWRRANRELNKLFAENTRLREKADRNDSLDSQIDE